MKKHTFLSRIALAAAGLGIVSCATADTDYGSVASWVTSILQEQHYSKVDFADELSAKALQNYLDTLDNDKMYFLKPEVESFRKKYSTELDDFVFQTDLSPAHEIYNTFKQRVTERFEKIKSLLEKDKLDFTGSGTAMLSRKDAEYPATVEEADALWKARITSEVLAERIRNKLAEEKKAEKKEEKSKEEVKKPAPAADEKKSEEAKPTEAGKSPEAEKKAEQKPKAPVSPEQKVLKRYQRFFDSLKENDEEDIANFFLSALSQSYDPHSDYMSAPEDEQFKIEMKKQLQGIGAVLSMRDGAAEIERLVSGAPAHLSGQLKVHDRIIGVAQGVDGEMEDVEGMKLNKVVEKIRGEEGTIVRLKVQPADDPTGEKEVTLKRAKVELKESLAKADLIETTNEKGEPVRIGWIMIDSFYADMERHTVSVTKDVSRLIQRLQKEGVGALVIDLRGNGGGSLEEAISLTGLFIKKGPVVQQKSWNGNIESRSSRRAEPLYDGPLAVLTDRTSASASEIFAAALQDYGRAVVIGDKSTFGKGTVQTILDVRKFMPVFAKSERAGSLKVTIQKFYRIAGGSTQLKGVVPDLILPSRLDALDIGESALKDPLPFDTIKPQQYDTADVPLPNKELQARMSERIAKDPEFQYIREDIARLSDQIKKNTLSLNEAERLKEIQEKKDRAKQRREERKTRLADIEKNYKVFRLTLENLDQENLVPLEKAKGEEKGNYISDEEEDEEADERDEFPLDIEPVKAETLNIVKDLIHLNREARTAKVQSAATPRD